MKNGGRKFGDRRVALKTLSEDRGTKVRVGDVDESLVDCTICTVRRRVLGGKVSHIFDFRNVTVCQVTLDGERGIIQNLR